MLNNLYVLEELSYTFKACTSRLCMKMSSFMYARACAMPRTLYSSCGIPFPLWTPDNISSLTSFMVWLSRWEVIKKIQVISYYEGGGKIVVGCGDKFWERLHFLVLLHSSSYLRSFSFFRSSSFLGYLNFVGRLHFWGQNSIWICLHFLGCFYFFVISEFEECGTAQLGYKIWVWHCAAKLLHYWWQYQKSE